MDINGHKFEIMDIYGKEKLFNIVDHKDKAKYKLKKNDINQMIISRF